MSHKSFAAHTFSGLDTLPFKAEDYSRLKFGCDDVARKFGHELAEKFFAAHTAELLANRCVVIPSPYNHVKNAASVMTEHFVNRINHLLVRASGEHVETSIIHRKVSYTNDYGFLGKEQRRSLIDNDHFFMNRDFLKGKTLIFIDDVRITGTHEEKLVEILNREKLENDSFFLYYGDYAHRGVGCDIEGAINFAAVATIDDYVEMAKNPRHHLIVRPIKFLLKQDEKDFRRALAQMPIEFMIKVYEGCLGEGYYRIPEYQSNFGRIAEAVEAHYAMA